jgi:hypothetical protein
MAITIHAKASDTEPRIFFRKVKHGNDQDYNPSDEDKEKLQSLTFVKAVDLVCEGPIQGFCDATGGSVDGSDILKGVYYNEVPVQNTEYVKTAGGGQYNFRNVNLAYRIGVEDQAPLYEEQDNNFYWFEDFSYTSQTIPLNIALSNSIRLEDGLVQPSILRSQASHSVIDNDVDWLGVTLSIPMCYSLDDIGSHKPNTGGVHIWGDISGVAHRSLAENEVKFISDDGFNERNVFVKFDGLALNPYKEDVFLKLIDLNDLPGGKPRPRKIYIQNTTEESYNFKSKFAVSLESVTEIVKVNLSYPSSAYIGSVLTAESFSSIPSRSYDLKLKKVKVPSNYVDKLEGPNGPTKIRAYAYGSHAKGSEHNSEERHEGIWDGTFKEELEWTDNPAWILYDIITNDRYGLGEYTKDINIDKWELYKIAKYCDEVVETSKPVEKSSKSFVQERRYTCNIMLHNPMEAYGCIKEIASIFRGMVYFNNLEVFVSLNGPKEPIATFTNDNIVEGMFSYGGVPKHTKFTAVKVAYKDRDQSFLPKYEYLEDPEGIIRYGLLEKEITAAGCTSRDQAKRVARWILLSSNREEEQVSFGAYRDAERLMPGDIFTVKDELKNDFIIGGRVRHIENNHTDFNKNFIMLDRQLPTGEYFINKISFLVPRGDQEDFKQNVYSDFIHRNGYNISAGIDAGSRGFDNIPINSETSDNQEINNYFEGSTSGTLVKTNSDEPLVISQPKDENDLMDGGAGYATLNDYFLSTGLLAKMTEGDDRKNWEYKIIPGTIYIVHAESKQGKKFDQEKNYELVAKQENSNGTYSITAVEYDSGKFNIADDDSPIFTSAGFRDSFDTDDATPGPGGGGPGLVEVGEPEVQIIHYGFPRENTVDLLVSSSGYVNNLGQSKAKVKYYFHSTRNQDHYYLDESSDGRYEIRVQEISTEYYTRLSSSKNRSVNVLQNGQYVLPEQKCGQYKILYDPSEADLNEGPFGPDNKKATVGGAANKSISVPGFEESSFDQAIEVKRPREVQEMGNLSLKGCTVFEESYTDLVTGNVLSGEFEVPNPEAYYEIRWCEANKYGRSPNKIGFFKANADHDPPPAPTDFRVKISTLFPNALNFNWNQEEKPKDLAGFRIYTGHIGGNNTDLEFTDLTEEKPERNTYFNPKEGSEFAEITGPNTTYFTYEADTSDGTIRDNDGNRISFNETGAFHLRAFDHANNLSDPLNSNLISIFDVSRAPNLYLSGEIRERGEGTDSYSIGPILHAFYSGNYHEAKAFKKYYLQIYDETNGWPSKAINIYKDDVVVADPKYNAGESGHLEISEVAPNTTYFGKLAAYTVDDRSSPAGTSRTTIGQDNIPPAPLENFRVTKQFSNFRFLWDIPKEYDVSKVLLFTGYGQDNFSMSEAEQNSIDAKIENEPNEAPFASVLPDDFPSFTIDKFRDQGGESWDKTSFPFHALAVDTSNNTGMYTGFTYKYANLAGPIVHTSGELTADGRSLIHVFYSGAIQNDESYKYYLTRYQETQDTTVASYVDTSRAKHDPTKLGMGSGHFSFEAKGNRLYEVETRSFLDVLETDWGQDKPLSNAKFSSDSAIINSPYIYAPPDNVKPGIPTWVNSTKNGNNVFLSWNNPSDFDLDRILLYSGYANKTGRANGTIIHQQTKATSEVIPLRDFAKNENMEYYFWLRAVDTSNNTGDFSKATNNPQSEFGQRISVGRTDALDPDEIITSVGLQDDDKGDGSIHSYISYKIEDELNYQHAYYKVDLAADPQYRNIVGSQFVDITYGVGNTGSGVFPNLLANKNYYIRARIHEFDGKYSIYTNSADNPIVTPKDTTPPINPVNFNIISGPKQAVLEWDWGDGISSDIESVLVYKTGIPTGRVEIPSNKDTNCWKIQDISGYFQDHPDEYQTKLSASTFYIDSDIETGVPFPTKNSPKQTVYYHYLLKTVDRSNNTGEHFVSGKSLDQHSFYFTNEAETIKSAYVNEQYGDIPHTQGYITGGSIGANYITNVYASRILTDVIKTNSLILGHPSGRILSDNVHARASNDDRYAYAKGSGIFMDHKMFRIGDPGEAGSRGFGLFWTGEKLANGQFKQPTFSKDKGGFHFNNVNPNTLEIRGNMTAGTIDIGDNKSSSLNVDSEGTLTIGNQNKSMSGFFIGTQRVSGIMGQVPIGTTADPEGIYVQLDTNDLSAVEKAQLNALALGGGFLETNWIRGDLRGWEVRAIEEVNTSSNQSKYGTVKLGIPFQAYVGFNFYDIQGNTYGLSGVVTTGTKETFPANNQLGGYPKYRDWWRVHEAKFKVTNEGTLFAADARILGTAKADSLEVGKTITLGEGAQDEKSIIETFEFDEDIDLCNPSSYAGGWRIRGDGHAIFKSIDLRSGIISGRMGLHIGDGCKTRDFFRVSSFGEMSIGPSLIPKHNNFYVSNQGDLRAKNATISGDLAVTGTIDVREGIRVSNSPKGAIYIFPEDIRSEGFLAKGGQAGFKLQNNGRAFFHSLNVTGGFISGVDLIMGRGTQTEPWLKVSDDGEISIGSYATAANGQTPFTVPNATHPFYVNKKGTLYAKNANISGSITGSDGVIGSLAFEEGWVGTYDRKTQNVRNTKNSTTPGVFIGTDGTFTLQNNAGTYLSWVPGQHDYVAITGIASASNVNGSDYTQTEDKGGKGKGFYIRGLNAGSYISNFKTDSFSASGIAKLVDTQICGEIKDPEQDKHYTILAKSAIGYEVKALYLETDSNNCTVQFGKSKAGSTYTAIGASTYQGTTAGRAHKITQATRYIAANATNSYIVIKPTAIGTNSSIRFRILLRRDGNFSY